MDDARMITAHSAGREVEIDYFGADVWARLDDSARTFRATAGTRANWVRCEPGWRWRFTLRDYDVWAVTRGRGTANVNRRPVAVGAGTVLMLRPGDVIDAQQDESDRLEVGFLHYSFETRPPEELLPPRVVQLPEPAAVWDRLRIAITASRSRDPSGPTQASAELGALIIGIHVQAARSIGALQPRIDVRVRRAIELVHERLAERPTLADAAAAAQLAPDTLSRLFRSELGQTFREYCVAARIGRARELLAETTMNVAEVARALGYADHRLFTRQFASLNAGCPPSTWRATRG
jgi:AraC-like DNA-binding protein